MKYESIRKQDAELEEAQQGLAIKRFGVKSLAQRTRAMKDQVRQAEEQLAAKKVTDAEKNLTFLRDKFRERYKFDEALKDSGLSTEDLVRIRLQIKGSPDEHGERALLGEILGDKSRGEEDHQIEITVRWDPGFDGEAPNPDTGLPAGIVHIIEGRVDRISNSQITQAILKKYFKLVDSQQRINLAIKERQGEFLDGEKQEAKIIADLGL